MNTPGLREYRCACGKLLFKGLLVLSVIEVKCKRCGKIKVFDEHGKNDPVSFTVKIDSDWNIVDASHAVLRAGWECQSLIGKHLSEILPLLKDASEIKRFAESVKSGKLFEMRNSALLLRDGSSAPAESYVVPCSSATGGHKVVTIFTA